MASVKSSFDEVKAAYQKMRTNLLIVLLIILAALIIGWFSPRLSLIPTAAAAVVWLKVYRPGVKAYASLATAPLSLSRPDGKRAGLTCPAPGPGRSFRRIPAPTCGSLTGAPA